MNVKFHKITSSYEIYRVPVFSFLLKFDIHFLRLPREIFLHLLAFRNGKKECNIHQIFLVQVFCPLRIKITQSPRGFHLKVLKGLA